MDEKAQDMYLEALIGEIELKWRDFMDCTFNTLYIGGGTPSTLKPAFISKLTKKLFTSFHFAENAEFTIEINPMSFTKEDFFEYIKAGVNRVSVGVQCLNEKALKKVGRIQTYDSVYKTFEILANSGFQNISADVMLGLPGQSKRDVRETIEFLLDYDVKHISVYTLQIEKGSKLYQLVKKRRIRPMSGKKQVSLYNYVYSMLTKEGFLRYEISNFCVPKYESAHNRKYWDGTQYLGLGVAAHSYIDGYRYQNLNRMDLYYQTIKAGKSPIYTREYVSDKQRRTEMIMLSLRTAKGLNLEKFKAEFNEDLLRSKAEQIKQLKKLNAIKVKDGYLRIVEDKFNVSNSIILELI